MNINCSDSFRRLTVSEKKHDVQSLLDSLFQEAQSILDKKQSKSYKYALLLFELIQSILPNYPGVESAITQCKQRLV